MDQDSSKARTLLGSSLKAWAEANTNQTQKSWESHCLVLSSFISVSPRDCPKWPPLLPTGHVVSARWLPPPLPSARTRHALMLAQALSQWLAWALCTLQSPSDSKEVSCCCGANVSAEWGALTIPHYLLAPDHPSIFCIVSAAPVSSSSPYCYIMSHVSSSEIILQF